MPAVTINVSEYAHIHQLCIDNVIMVIFLCPWFFSINIFSTDTFTSCGIVGTICFAILGFLDWFVVHLAMMKRVWDDLRWALGARRQMQDHQKFELRDESAVWATNTGV